MGSMSMDRMGSGFDRMGMSGMDMNRGFGGSYGHMGGGMSDRGSGSKAGCQIFVRNVSVCWICADMHVEKYRAIKATICRSSLVSDSSHIKSHVSIPVVNIEEEGTCTTGATTEGSHRKSQLSVCHSDICPTRLQ